MGMDFLAVFGIRGRQKDVYRLDDAMRALGLHPRRVPDPVKLATLRLLKRTDDSAARFERVAPVLAYCMLGAGDFTAANGPSAAQAAEARLHHAIDCGDSLDAELVMLTLLAGVAHPAVVERFGLEVGAGGPPAPGGR